jgi:hypothetical protein
MGKWRGKVEGVGGVVSGAVSALVSEGEVGIVRGIRPGEVEERLKTTDEWGPLLVTESKGGGNNSVFS